MMKGVVMDNTKGISNFRYACKLYNIQKKWLSRYEAITQINESNDSVETQRYFIMKNNVLFVEKQFAEIERKHGIFAKQLLWECLVEGRKQEELSQIYGIALRTIQRRFHEWLKVVS